MSFVSFLKQFGLDVLKGVQIFEGIEPAASAVLGASTPTGKVLDTASQMVGSALNIEAIFAAAFGPDNKGGTAKLAALIPQVQQIVLNSEMMIGKTIGDQALFIKAIQGYAQASVDFTNSLKASVQTSDKTNAPSIPPSSNPIPAIASAISTTGAVQTK